MVCVFHCVYVLVTTMNRAELAELIKICHWLNRHVWSQGTVYYTEVHMVTTLQIWLINSDVGCCYHCYLSSRSFCVKCDNHLSSLYSSFCDVPRGCVLVLCFSSCTPLPSALSSPFIHLTGSNITYLQKFSIADLFLDDSQWITDRSLCYASPHLWNQLPASLQQPRTSLSILDSLTTIGVSGWMFLLLTWVVPDKIHRGVKRLCEVYVCVFLS